jgi:hypothetical protein
MIGGVDWYDTIKALLNKAKKNQDRIIKPLDLLREYLFSIFHTVVHSFLSEIEKDAGVIRRLSAVRLLLILIQYVVMPHVHEDNHYVTFIKPNNTNIHVDVTFKQISRSLYPLCTQGRVHGVFGKQLQLVLKLLLFIRIQVFEMLFEAVGKGKLICHPYFSNSSNRLSMLSKTGWLPALTLAFTSLISVFSSSTNFLGYRGFSNMIAKP